MADRKIPRAEDVFSGRLNGNRDASANVYKNKKAPTPPSGPLPKIGNYQPKSLLAPAPGGPVPDLIERQSENSPTKTEERKPKPFVMGDKDTPLKIEQSLRDDQPVAPPRRKRRAPSVPGTDPESNKVSENPIFGRSMSNVSTSATTDTDFEEQGGVFDFGIIPNGDRENEFKNHGSANDFSNISTNGTIEPDYEERGGDVDFGVGIDDISLTGEESSSRKHPLTPEVIQNGDSEYPYIPPPDYDDEEYTFTFEEERANVFKEYAGEDFGKYLQDDEDLQHYQRPRGMKGSQGLLYANPSRQSRPPREKKYKKKWKQPKHSEQSGRNTIRDFTFTDTKIGWGDRTVKSTSAKGRYIKREKERNRLDPRAAFPRPRNEGPSYEDFLKGKTGMQDSPNSSDSGVDTGEDLLQSNGLQESTSNGESNAGFIPDDLSSRRDSDIFYHSQPKQLRNGLDKHEHKASIWKRLTWRFKRSVNISKLSDR